MLVEREKGKENRAKSVSTRNEMTDSTLDKGDASECDGRCNGSVM